MYIYLAFSGYTFFCEPSSFNPLFTSICGEPVIGLETFFYMHDVLALKLNVWNRPYLPEPCLCSLVARLHLQHTLLFNISHHNGL